MATEALLPLPRQVFYDANGVPLAGGFVHTYVPNTTTPKTTWRDAGGVTPNSNPITLDSAGSCLIYGAGSYQLTVTDADGASVPGYSGVTQSFGGAAPAGTFDTIIALRANTGTPAITQAWVGGYYTLGDGGEGMFWYNPSDTTTPDNGGTIIVDAAGNRWYREITDGSLQVKWFGAKGDGSTDDTTPFQHAIAAVSASGGVIFVPAGTFLITSTLTISASNVRLIGVDRGGTHDTNPVLGAASTLIWGGANHGTLINFAPVVGAQRIVGWGVEDIALVSGIFPYTTSADYGLYAQSCAYGTVKVTTIEFGIAAVATGGVSSTGFDNSLFQWNEIDIIARQINTSGTVLQMGGYNNVNNSCFNTVKVYAEYNNGIGIDLQDADNNTFTEVYLQLAGGGTGTAMIMRGGTASVPGYARNNIFQHYSQSIGGGNILSEGLGVYGSRTVTQPAVQNQILFFDSANGPFSLSLGTNSTFWTGKNTLPQPYYDFYLSGLGGYRADAAGLYEIWGATAAIPQNTVLPITFPNSFSLPNGIFYGAAISGENAAVFSVTSPSATGFTLFVGPYPGPPANAVWYWRVWGR